MKETKKTVLFLSSDFELITKTREHYEESSHLLELKFIDLDLASAIVENLEKFNLFIIESDLLMQDFENSNLAEIIIENKTTAPIIILGSKQTKQIIPGTVSIYAYISQPVNPRRLWNIIDELIQHNFI